MQHHSKHSPGFKQLLNSIKAYNFSLAQECMLIQMPAYRFVRQKPSSRLGIAVASLLLGLYFVFLYLA